MEERIQRKVNEIKNKYTTEYFKTKLYKPLPTYEALREEAVRIVEEDIKKEEDLKKHQEERERDRKYKELEEERNVILENRITSNRLLVIADIEEIECDEEYGVMANFESELLKKALDELNIEIIKRIVRKTYPHKFA